MNKQNAKIFTLCLLLSAGAALGLKVKEKTEKNQIKKELETVLIPNAERELDSLIFIHRSLRDSIVYFNGELQKQSQYTQIKKQIPAIKEISNNLNILATQWHNTYTETEDDIAEYTDSANIPQKLTQRIDYLTNDFVSSSISNNRRFDSIAENLQNALDTYTDYFYEHDPQNVSEEYKFIDAFYTYLHKTKDLIYGINNSQNLFNERDLQLLGYKTDLAITEFCKLQNANKTYETTKKLQQFKQLKTESNIKLDKQMRKVAELKTSFAPEKIYKSRHK